MKNFNKAFFVTIIVVVVLIVIIFFVALSPRYLPNGDTSIATDVLNMSYTIKNEEFTLKNGFAEKEIATDSATKNTLRVFGQPVYGDLDNDGDIDAAVLLMNDTGGSGSFFYAALAINNGTEGYRATNSMYLGDRIAPQTVEIHDGRAVYNISERRAGEPFTTRPSMGRSVWVYYDIKNNSIGEWVKDFEGEIACTLEAKLCPDGSYVGRTGPKCEFAKCPEAGSDGGQGFLPYNSGVAGRVMMGPTCPVETIPPDPKCADKPYQTSVFVFRAIDLTHTYATGASDKNGYFNFSLPPGDYMLGAGESQFPSCDHPTVKVLPDKFVSAEISCDTGIR